GAYEPLHDRLGLCRRGPQDHGFTRPTWTLEIGVLLSITHVWRLVKRLGARWGRPRPIVACPWKARRRQRRIAAIQRRVLTPGNNEYWRGLTISIPNQGK